jgi:hypothetical protein
MPSAFWQALARLTIKRLWRRETMSDYETVIMKL